MEKQKQEIRFGGKWVDIATIINLNKELTAENTKLLNKLDKSQSELQKQRDTWDEFYPLLVDRNKKLQSELDEIKSRPWYKIFKWLGVW